MIFPLLHNTLDFEVYEMNTYKNCKNVFKLKKLRFQSSFLHWSVFSIPTRLMYCQTQSMT